MYEAYKPQPKRPRAAARGTQGAVACAQAFCKTTSIHGFAHIAAPNRAWIERVMWVFVTGAAIWGAVYISLGQLQRFNENPTVVALEKDFRSWDFCLPGITLCQDNKVDESKLPSVIKQYWNIERNDEKYDYYKRFVTTLATTNKFNLERLGQFEGEDLEVDLFQLVVDVMPELDIKATWSATSRAVRWYPIASEAGLCFSTNTVALPNDAIVKLNASETSIFPLTCKYSSLNCYVNIEVHNSTNFYVHSPYDIMDANADPVSLDVGVERGVDLSVSESGCGRGVRGLQPRRRRCLYTDEPLEGGQVFSTNTCRRSCRSQQTLKEYGCKPFYNYFEDGPLCSLAQTRALRAAPAPACACPSMCVDALFKQLKQETQNLGGGPFMSRQGVFKVRVQAPRTRYTREIVFHFQDLVVSFGGAAGLFLGASFISFVEILYFVLERTLGALAVQHEEPQTVQVKKETKVPYERARIMELNAILEGRRFHPGTEPPQGSYKYW